MTVALDQFVAVIAELFSPDLTIGANTRFKELEEWSSMQALILIAAVDEHFGVTLPEREFRSATTVEDLFIITKSLKKDA